MWFYISSITVLQIIPCLATARIWCHFIFQAILYYCWFPGHPFLLSFLDFPRSLIKLGIFSLCWYFSFLLQPSFFKSKMSQTQEGHSLLQLKHIHLLLHSSLIFKHHEKEIDWEELYLLLCCKNLVNRSRSARTLDDKVVDIFIQIG